MKIKFTKENRKKYFNVGKQVVFSLRIHESAYELVRYIAEENKRSINSQIIQFIEDGLVTYHESFPDDEEG